MHVSKWIWKRYVLCHICYLYIYNEDFFVNRVKTTERINMGFRPYDAKSFVDGHRLLFIFIYLFLFHISFLILFLINFHPHICPPIKTCKYEYNRCYGKVCSYLFFVLKQNYYIMQLFFYL